jgi:hypothetical protein
MLAAAVAMAWQGRADVPDNVDLHSGTCLTWGNDLVWGVFPTSGGTGTTYVYAYHPEADTWDSIEPMAGVFLDHTGITFQWIEQPVLWGIGRHENLSKLYWYFQDSAQWRQDTIDTFALDDGACIAYVPNVNYTRQMNPVPGWIYCLPDDERSFWRCALPTSLPNVALDGIYPGQGATIAELTPLFQWEGAATNQYRLQVSTDLFFIQNVIDEVVSSPEYEPTTELANGTYYWRTAAWIGGSWTWCLTAHSFLLHGGWEQLDSIPYTVGDGAVIAYDGGSLSHQAILAFAGAAGTLKRFCEFNIAQGTWTELDEAPENVDGGSSLTTSDPTQEQGERYIMASFYAQSASETPYRYVPEAQQTKWQPWDDDNSESLYNSHYPHTLGVGSSMVLGTDQAMYLTIGSSDSYRHRFYNVIIEANQKGEQAGVMPNGRAMAHAIASHDGIEIEYQLSATARVSATLHDAVGRQVGTLDAGEQKPGLHQFSWDRDNEGRKLSAGAYFVLLDMGTEQTRLKAVVK